MIRLVVISLALATPALAADQVPAPAYFVTTVMETSTAQQLALSCPEVSVNPVHMTQRTETVLEQLNADGFTEENLNERMQDPTEAIAVLQQGFLEKHDLVEGAEVAAVCAAAQAEIAEQSGIGHLLIGAEE